MQTDGENLRPLLEETLRLSHQYLQEIDQQRVSHPDYKVQLPQLPDEGLGGPEVLRLFREAFYPLIVGSSGPRYWGFVTGGTTPAAIAGDWLTTVFDQNTQNASGTGDVSAALELHTVRLLLEMFGLPDVFTGGMVTGATMSNFTGLAVARQWMGQTQNRDIAREGLLPGIKVYAAVPHSSAIKSLAMLGMGSANLVAIPALPGRESMDTQAFEVLLRENRDQPFILIANAGTVNTVDFDDFTFIKSLREKHRFWWHVDAAFGGFAACSPRYRHLVQGWEDADSITVDFHKWLNTPYDSAAIFIRKEHAALQVATFQNSNAPYLGDPLAQFNYLNFLPENSRRFRALPVWFTLMAYGKEGYRSLVERCCGLAHALATGIKGLEGFELAAPVRLNTVCFRLSSPHEQKTDALLQALARSGRLFITPTVYRGMRCLRAALVNWRTGPEDIAVAIEELKTALQKA